MTKMNQTTTASSFDSFDSLDDNQLVTTTGGMMRPVPIPQPVVDAGKKVGKAGVGYVKRGWKFLKDHVKPADVLL